MPVQEFTFDDIKNILVNRIGLSEAAVVDDPSLSFEQLGLDSLAFVEIQLAMQQEYGFTIPDEFFVGYGFSLAGRYRNLPDLRLVH